MNSVKNSSPRNRNGKGLFFLPPPLALLILVSACTFGQYSPQELDATVQQLAATGIVLTLSSLPTATVAPSNTANSTQEPTATLQPSPLPTDTPTATFQPTWTPYGQLEPTDFVNSKANKDDKNAPLLLDNQSGEEIRFIILSPVYVEYTFTKSFSLILNEDVYQYRAWIGKHGPLNGTFSITNGDKHILTFYANKIHFSTP